MKPEIKKRNNVTVIGNDPSKETIIFAHGFGSDQSAWQPQVEAFKNDYNIVLFDMVGAGNSDFSAYSPHRYSTLHTYADDMIEIVHELNLDKPILVSHSVSGMISLLAAVREPGIFKKIVFIGASPRYLNDKDYTGGFEQTDLDGLFNAMSVNYHAWAAGFSAMAMGNPERPELGEEFARTLSAIRPDVAQAVARVIFQSDHRNDLSKLKAETLIIQSSEDIAVPMEVGAYLHKYISNSKLMNIKARGHFPHMSEPDEVIGVLRTFIHV
ncbi:MAG: alpha/beta hydrolase [Bacteroidota bacterium]